MHLIRYALAALACAFIGAASASTVTLQLTDLTYSAYSLNPLGGSAAVGLSHDPYHVVGNLLGTREQQHEESSWSHGASMYLSGESTLPGNYARTYGFWNSNLNGQPYDIHAGAEVVGSLSQWYFAESLLDTSATLTLTPNSVAVVSGHLEGTSEFDGADAQAVFSMLLEGGGNFSAYERVFGTGSELSAVNDFFTLTLFNRTDQALDLNWKLDVGLTASRAIPTARWSWRDCWCLLCLMQLACCGDKGLGRNIRQRDFNSLVVLNEIAVDRLEVGRIVVVHQQFIDQRRHVAGRCHRLPALDAFAAVQLHQEFKLCVQCGSVAGEVLVVLDQQFHTIFARHLHGDARRSAHALHQRTGYAQAAHFAALGLHEYWQARIETAQAVPD